MSKYYISSGTLQLIYSTKQQPYSACRTVIHEMNEHDILDEYMYIDQRGMKDYTNADQLTFVVPTKDILRKEGYPAPKLL